jgi:membrane fusion protein (multidrug efflux system)
MMVASNALLYTIDDRPFRAALEQAKGAQAQALALQEKAGRDANRLRPLWEKNAISRQQYDDAIAAERNAAAALQSARAAVDSAEIQLGYTKIHSPIEGLVGKTEVKPGNLVGRGTSTLLTTVSEVNPISVRFSISEKEYLAWKRRRGSDDERSRNASEDLFELILADGTYHNYRGRVSFADRQVDPKTGTLLLQVNFPNPDRLVRPGQFGRVRFAVETVTNAVLVPQRAVSELQATYSVFVVSADRKAEFRKVSPGARVGTFYVIQEGLQPGENIVIEGIQKLSNNALVTPAYTNLAAALPPLNPHHP